MTVPNSFDHLVGEREQLIWYGQTKRPGGIEVNRKLVFGRSLRGEVSRIGTLEDTIDIRPSGERCPLCPDRRP
jgi:hypothetical protein